MKSKFQKYDFLRDRQKRRTTNFANGKTHKSHHFVRPGNYRIEVEGYLDESWSDRLAAMRIVTRKRADQTIVATLTGWLRDQAELLGVLNSLYNLHLSILKVEVVSGEYCNQ